MLHAYQMGRHARTLDEQAAAAAESGQHDRAAVLLRRYLQLAPGDTKALHRYAEELEQLPGGDSRWLAVAAYKQVLEREPNNGKVRRHHVSIESKAPARAFVLLSCGPIQPGP